MPGKRITWRGMNIFDDGLGDKYRAVHQEKVGQWISDGTMQAVFSETKSIEEAPAGLADLFAGKNVGKAVIHFEQ